MADITPSQLTTINLKFGSHAKPLKLLAFVDLVSNALFLLAKPSSNEEIVAKVASLLGIKQVDEKRITAALKELNSDGKIKLISKQWQLSDEEKANIGKENEALEQSLRVVLKSHFPASVEYQRLHDWFLKAASDFFGFNGDEWIKSISKNKSGRFVRPQTVRQLLEPSIKSFKLQEFSDQLIDGFDSFLSSEEPIDLRYIMALGFAMFSARLVTADIGADPITLDEIKGSVFILDTNVLFAIQLGSHRLTKSIKALGQALNSIGASLVVLDTTKQEYSRVFIGKKGEIDSLFRQYPIAVITDTRNDFIEGGIDNGCKTVEDFDNYFDTFRRPPTQLSSGPKIESLDNSEIEAEVKKSEADSALKGRLQSNCLKLRGKWDKRPKRELALKHDASLIRVAEMQRKKDGRKISVLSLDRSLQTCAEERAGAHAIPAVFMLDGLIQILALHSGGPTQNAADFAPLLASILLNRCTPSERTYSIQDLRWLYTIQQRVVDFPVDEIKRFVNLVTKQRLSGATMEDPKLQLMINRQYQDKAREYERELEDARDRISGAEKEVVSVRGELTSANKTVATYKYVDGLRKLRNSLLASLSWRIPVALLISWVAFILATLAFDSTHTNTWLDWLCAVIALVAMIKGIILKPINNFREAKKALSR